MKEKDRGVTAIVPAYNEEKRIEKILNCLRKSKLIDEIIVVDDGSTDDTKKVIKKFKEVRYYKNKKNKGKGFSMDKGVRKSKTEIIFFCDADLVELTPQIVDDIIMPVKQCKVKMSIGARNKILLRIYEKLNLKIAISCISGERALEKEIWNFLPDFYKKGFRIETGLNYLVGKFLGGFEQKVFTHGQTIKEKKYPFHIAIKKRMETDLGVILAVIRFYFYDFFKYGKRFRD